MVYFKVTFNEQQQGEIIAGQSLYGTVQITLDEAINIRGISVNIYGYAKCRWAVSKSEVYEGREDYLNLTTYFVGQPNGDTFELPAGIHTYTFAVELPQNIPSSYDGKRGKIRYTAKIEIDRPWHLDNTYKTTFNVLQLLDLNDNYELRFPCRSEITKSFCCWPCESGPMYFSASIPKSGYVPGEAIDITMQVLNKSDIEVYRIEYKILKTVQYISTKPSRAITAKVVVVSDKRSVGFRVNDAGVFKEQILVPSITPTSILHSQTVQIRYSILIKGQASGFHKNPTLHLPITIGTTPIIMDPTTSHD